MAGSVGDGEFGFQIAPMLDILFVLLLFFMVSAGAQKHEGGIATQLPGGGGPGGTTPEKVDIDENGQVSIYGTPVDSPDSTEMPQLISRLMGVMKAHSDQPVIITPSRSTRQQRVVDVLNACTAAQVKNLAFGAPPD